MLTVRFEWFYNRPDAQQWIALINGLPSSLISKDNKKACLKYFAESKQSYKIFGLML